MSAAIERAAWSGYFKGYNQRNEARPTRMEIFGELGAQQAEYDLPFGGITLEEGGHDALQLQIMLGSGMFAEMNHLIFLVNPRALLRFPFAAARPLLANVATGSRA